MQVKIEDAPVPDWCCWKDIKIGEGAQARHEPGNIVLKTSGSTGLRLQAAHGSEAMTVQHPGSESQWYRCKVDLIFHPAVRAV